MASVEYTLILFDGNAYAGSIDEDKKITSSLATQGLSYADGVWIMENFNFSTTCANALQINSQNGADTTITVKGSNSISSTCESGDATGIVISTPCTFNGTGTLSVSADATGYYWTSATSYGIVCQGDAVFDGSVTVDVDVTQEEYVGIVGIKVGDGTNASSLTVQESATVNTTVTAAANWSSQDLSALNISSSGSVYVKDGGTIVAEKVNSNSDDPVIVGCSTNEPNAVAKETIEGNSLNWGSDYKGDYFYSDVYGLSPNSITLTAQPADYTIVLSNGKAYKYVYDAQSAPTYASCITAANIITVNGLTYADGVWTMEDFSFSTTAANALILNTESTITVKGTNAISAYSGYSLYSVEDCTINGTGTLTVSTDPTGPSMNKIAIYGSKDIVIGGDVTVNATATLDPNICGGGVVNGIKTANLTVQGNAKVSASATNTYGAASVGSIDATGSLTVKNNATITTSATGYWDTYETTTYGVHCASEPDAEAKDTSTGETLTWNSGYKQNDTEVTSLTLTAQHEDYTIVLSDGYAYKNTVDDNNKITVDGLSYADGVWTMTDLSFATTAAIALQTIGATTITVTGENYLKADCGTLHASSYAMSLADDITINGSGTLSASASKTCLEDGETSYGIYFQGKGTIGDSVTVNAIATAYTGTSAKGIYVSDNLTVKSNAQVSATAVLAENTDGFYPCVYGFDGGLTVENGAKVTANYELEVVPSSTVALRSYYHDKGDEPNASATDTETGEDATWSSNYATYVDGDNNLLQDVTLTAPPYDYTLVLEGSKAYKNYAYSGNEISTADLADMGLTYVDGIWTMENFTFTTTAIQGVRVSNVTTITVKGDNYISVDSTTYGWTNYMGMDLDGHIVTINGTGTLNVSANGPKAGVNNIGINGLETYIGGNVTLNVTATANENQEAYGIRCGDALYVKSSAEVTSTAVREAGSGAIYGVYASIIYLDGNGKVRATADEGSTSGDTASPVYAHSKPQADAVETQTDEELNWDYDNCCYTYSSTTPTDVTMTATPADYTIILKNGKGYKDNDDNEISTADLAYMGLTYSDGVWTMEDFCFNTTATHAVEISTSEVTLNLIGTNSITCDSNDTKYDAMGLIIYQDCTINGTGTLTISANSKDGTELKSFGLYVWNDLVLEGSVTIDTTAIAQQYTGDCGAYGLFNENGSTLTVKGEAQLNARVEMDAQCTTNEVYAVSGLQPSATAKDAQSGEELTWCVVPNDNPTIIDSNHYVNAQNNNVLDVILTSLPAASITTGNTTTSYATLAEAIAAVTEGQTIKLLQDLSDSTAISTQEGVEFTIDLNGYDYSNSAAFTNNGEITLTDSQEEGVKFSVASWTNTAAANTLDIDDTLDYEALSFSSTWTNPGTVTFDMTDATNSVYKLVDYTGTGSITSYGTVTLSNATGYTTQIINSDLYAVKTTETKVAVNTNWTDTAVGTELTVDETTYYYGCNAFDNNAAALELSGVQTLTFADGTYDSTTQGNAPEVNILAGTYNKKVLGGTIVSTASELEGNIALTIEDGTFAQAVACGDGVSANVAVTRQGNLTTSISGGTFNGVVAGGMFCCPSETPYTGTARVVGNLSLTITGGTFNNRIYGGNIARTDALGVNTTVSGSVSLTIDATSAIAINENVVAGSMGKGAVTGSVTVTFKGEGSNLTFGDDSMIFGGSNSDYTQQKSDNKVETVSYVGPGNNQNSPEYRNLVFDGFSGNFGAEIRMFGTAKFKNSSNVVFTDEDINLWAVEDWEFTYGSSASGLEKNDFYDDTLNLDLTGYNNQAWTVLSGTEDAFKNFGEFGAVTFNNGPAATYNSSNKCWSDGTYKLTLTGSGDDYSMVLTRA